VNIIVVTRPGYEIGFSHVTENIRQRIVDGRGRIRFDLHRQDKIYITDAVEIDVSATEIRGKIRGNETSWREDVPEAVARYVEKYGIY
jgi:nicotinic acid mononucleotide adenylyltransferase